MIIDKVKALLRPDVDQSVKLTGVGVFIGKTFDGMETRIADLEQRRLQKGDIGERGEKGDRGEKGERGAVGPAGADGKSITGPKGAKGDTGAVGTAGKAGVSVVDAEVAADDHLVLTLSNGKIIDAGELPAGRSGSQPAVHVAGNAWQIYVGDTPPANPYANQIWFATNLTSACN